MEKQKIIESLNDLIKLAQDTWPHGLAEKFPAVSHAIKTRDELIDEFRNSPASVEDVKG